MSSSLRGKVAIVTGSSRGIGAAIATSLAAEGAHVVVNHVSASSKASAEAVVKTIEGHGSKALLIRADVSSLSDIDRLVKETVEAFGKVDILVNNSGIGSVQPVGQITPEVYQSTFDINVRAAIFLSQAVVPHMGDGGRIINISGVNGRLAFPGTLINAASKAALESVTRVMGIELRDKGIRVTAINPGPVLTDALNGLPKEVQDHIHTNFPVAKVEDIADVVVFLAGPKSRWINAVTVGANNGVVLN